MKSFKLYALLFASIAAADGLHEVPHFHHRRQLNYTSSVISTTLTVYQTLVHTITSCAPTITNCPARSSAGAGVITDVVILTTTVCPVAAAGSIASSIISVAGGTSSAFTKPPTASPINTPLGTGLVGVGGSSTVGSGEASTPSETVLTYTLGSDSSTTVVTTTLKQTTTSTEYFTQYLTRSHSTPASPAGEIATQTGAYGTQTEVPTSQDEPTTTITSSSTRTKYVTVMLASSPLGLPANIVTAASTAGASGSGSGGGSGSGSGSCDCAAVAPVTVTVALATVTVTYVPMGASPTATPASSATSDETADEAAASTSSLSSGTAAAVVSPPAIIANGTAPYGNGTATGTKYSGSATGFLTVTRSSQTMSTDY